MYNTYKDGTEKLVGRYCGVTAPGPIESNRGATGVKIILHSDQEGVYSGFKAHYAFESVKSIFGGNYFLSQFSICVLLLIHLSMNVCHMLGIFVYN
jgi:hypothetical protein